METIDFKKIAEENTISWQGENLPSIEGEPFAFEKNNFQILKKLQENKFPVIDVQFLEMQNKDGTPKFACFSLRDTICSLGFELIFLREDSFSISRSASGIRSNIISQVIISKYKKVFESLAKEAWLTSLHNNSASAIFLNMTTTFPGIIDEQIRQEIRDAQGQFDHIYLICEASFWEKKSQITYFPLNKDPLVIGVKDEICYLIKTFDMTPLESYISKEFV